MTLVEMFHNLPEADKQKLADSLESVGLHVDNLESLSNLKITLEGTNFCGTVPADMAHSLWKLQVAYYRMVAQILYGSPSASLNSEEKEKYKLVFKIDKGSTNGVANIDHSFFDLASQALDKMEPWQILLAVGFLCATYLGKNIISHFTEKKKIEVEAAKETERQETIRKMLDTHKNIFDAAFEAGRDGRMAIIKGTTGVTKANIGIHEYDEKKIAEIRRRAARVSATSATEHLCITVDELDARDKDNPTLIVHEKNSNTTFKALLALNPDDYSDYDNILDIVWNSARFSDKYFWAEVTFTKRRDKIISASISSVAQTEEDLPQLTDDQSE